MSGAQAQNDRLDRHLFATGPQQGDMGHTGTFESLRLSRAEGPLELLELLLEGGVLLPSARPGRLGRHGRDSTAGFHFGVAGEAHHAPE